MGETWPVLVNCCCRLLTPSASDVRITTIGAGFPVFDQLPARAISPGLTSQAEDTGWQSTIRSSRNSKQHTVCSEFVNSLKLHHKECKGLRAREFRGSNKYQSERRCCGRICRVRSRPVVRSKPAQQSPLKFATSCSPCHGMARLRHQPEFNMAGRSIGNQL